MDSKRLTAERIDGIRERLGRKYSAEHMSRFQIAAVAADAQLDVEDLLADRAALEQRVGELEAALRPFAVWSKHMKNSGNQQMLVDVTCIHKAAKALADGEA